MRPPPLGRRPDEDFAEEIEAHVAIETDRLVAEGLSRDQARAAALRAFGSVTRARERYYEAHRWTFVEQARQDVGYAVRTLRQSPAYLATAVLTLAAGIGLITVAFSVLNAYVLRPYEIRDPHTLHKLAWTSPTGGSSIFRWRDYEALRARTDLFTGLVAESSRFISSGGRPVAAALVSDNYFDVLGPSLAYGRGLGPADGGGTETVVLSDSGWRRLLGASPSALGSTIELGGRPFHVVGIAMPSFGGLGDPPCDLWMSFTTFGMHINSALLAADAPPVLGVFGRLRPEVSPQRASAALTPLVAEAFGRAESVRADVTPQPSPNVLSFGLAAALAPVFAAFGLVLATACANVSNVMLARAIARQREIAVRLALGAGRARIVRQLVTEGVVVAAAAGAVAVVLAYWLLHAGAALVLSTLPPSVGALVRFAPAPFDVRVFAFALGMAAVATLMFAPLPALQASRLRLTDALRGQATAAAGRSRLRSALVATQVGVSLVLIVLALTIARAARAIGAIDPGYATGGVLSVNIRGDEHELLPKASAALRRDPRIADVAVAAGNPLFIRSRDLAAWPADGDARVSTRFTFVSPEYFSVLRIEIDRGRPFTPGEARAGAALAIVSHATARAFWANADPIGKAIRLEPLADGDRLPFAQVTVIGTTRDVASGFVMDGLDSGHIYLPADDRHAQVRALLVRPRAPDLAPAALEDVFRRELSDPDVFEVLPLAEMHALQLYPLRAASAIGLFLACVALALSISGLYGVLSYVLSGRRREIGIRMALGASTAAVVRLVLLHSLRLAAVGLIGGATIVLSALFVLNGLVRLRTATLLDPLALGSGLALVLASVVLAAWRPAHRSARVDPAQTLRAE